MVLKLTKKLSMYVFLTFILEQAGHLNLSSNLTIKTQPMLENEWGLNLRHDFGMNNSLFIIQTVFKFTFYVILRVTVSTC